MRYTKIEVTGSPIQPWWHTTTDLYTDLSQLKKFGEPLSKTEDGLLFFITGNFYKFILIPETHPIFNVVLTKYFYYNKSVYEYRQLLSKMIVDNYIKKLYTQEVVNSHRRKIQTMKVN